MLDVGSLSPIICTVLKIGIACYHFTVAVGIASTCSPSNFSIAIYIQLPAPDVTVIAGIGNVARGHEGGIVGIGRIRISAEPEADREVAAGKEVARGIVVEIVVVGITGA